MINEGSIKSVTHSPGIFQKEFNKERPAMLEIQNFKIYLTNSLFGGPFMSDALMLAKESTTYL